MTEEEFLSASPREIALYVSRLEIRDEKLQLHTAQILAMLINCNSTEESRAKAGKPNGWSPEDFMPRRSSTPPEKKGMSLQDWALQMEKNGYVDEPATEAEKELERKKAEEFKKQFTGVFRTKSEVQLVPE